ncbi:MAG: archease, partial [Pirellulaceae bacterium]|nr:archease [Pirellulaceae bacterium]
MYELFEHTADLGLRATAPDLDTLFAEMGACLFAA